MVTLLSLYKVIVIIRFNHEVNCIEIEMKCDDGASPTLRAKITIVNWFKR